MSVAYVIVGTATYESLRPEDRRKYREIEPSPAGDTRYALDLDYGENFEGLKDHSEWGPLVRALHRQQAEGAKLKDRLAELQRTRLPDGVDPAILAGDDIVALKRQCAAELFAAENLAAGELAQARAEREKLEKVLADYDRKHALKMSIRKAGILPKMESAVVALLLDRVQLVGEKPMAMTPYGMQSLDDFIVQWSMSEDGEGYRQPDAPRRANRRAQPGTFAARVAGMK